MIKMNIFLFFIKKQGGVYSPIDFKKNKKVFLTSTALISQRE